MSKYRLLHHLQPSLSSCRRSAPLDAVSKADEIFVIGYSFPKTDDDQSSLIRDAVRARKMTISRLTIINYNAPLEYIENIRSLLQPETVVIFNDGFADFSARGRAFESSLGYPRALEPAR